LTARYGDDGDRDDERKLSIWSESVVRESGRIVDGKLEEFQVLLKIGFKIERKAPSMC
jgi:flavin-binding protein dodecin